MAAVSLLIPRSKAFIVTAKGRYEVVKTRCVHGTNLTFSADIPGAPWARRQLKRVGIHLKAPRDAIGSWKGDAEIYAVAVSCKGHASDEDLNQIDVECQTEAGQTLSTIDNLILHGPNNRVCFIFFYTDTDSTITNLMAKEVRIFRKSDRQELTRLTLPR